MICELYLGKAVSFKRRVEILQSIFSDHNGINVKINKRKVTGN